MSNLFRRAWARVTEPKIITLLQTTIYAIIAFAGWAALENPPTTIENQWGPLLTNIWGWFLFIGGTGGAIACPTGKWFIEKPALLLAGTGVLMYGTVIFALNFTTPGNRLVQLSFVTMALIQLVIRLLRIHRFAYEPGT